jgi:hypothetical protein
MGALALVVFGSPVLALDGITVHSLDPAQTPRYAEAGFHVVRFDLGWSHIEKAPGRFDWSGYDPFVAALRSRGITPLLILG